VRLDFDDLAGVLAGDEQRKRAKRNFADNRRIGG
jgi:hypothetical protein